jgi:thermosome
MTGEKITSENTERFVGREAQRNNILAARVLAETVKTTLGPRGMDKMLVDSVGNITVTNDGVTILSEMEIEHPAAKMIVEIAKTQENEVGDGTTTAVMLAGKLLENAEKLLDQKIHPTIITRGYKLAAEKSKQILNELCAEISTEEELAKIAQTAMTGKGAEYTKDKLDMIIINAVKAVANDGKINLEDIKIEKQRGSSIEDTELIRGVVLDNERASQEMPNRIIEGKIALLECALEVKGPERDARISISSPTQFQEYVTQEEDLLRFMVNKISETGANVVACQRGIDEVAQFYLAKKGIYAVRRIAKTDMQRLAKATGGKIVSNLKELSAEDLGKAKLVEEKKENDNGMTYITGCENPKAVTILVRGGTEHVLDEIERAIDDALGDVSSVLKDSKVVAGGGAVEIELAKRLREYAQTIKGREQFAIEEFASAMEYIPITLAENAGLDPLDVLTELRMSHESGNKNAGLNLFSGRVEDTMMRGIIEPLKVKTQAISSSSEVAMMILRIDDVIASKGSRRRKSSLNEIEDYD